MWGIYMKNTIYTYIMQISLKANYEATGEADLGYLGISEHIWGSGTDTDFELVSVPKLRAAGVGPAALSELLYHLAVFILHASAHSGI